MELAEATTRPEALSPELILWGITTETLEIIRNLSPQGCVNATEHLNRTGVPAPYCYQCDTCDIGSQPEKQSDNSDLRTLFRPCQQWSPSSYLQIREAMRRHALDRQQRAQLDDIIAAVLEEIGDEEIVPTLDTIPTEGADPHNSAEPWNNEEIAAEVLAALVNGTLEHNDTQTGSESSGRHDYNIRSLEGRVIALEITQRVNSQRRAQQEYIESRLTPLHSFRHNWSVGVRGEARLEALRDRLPEILSKLEELGIDSLYTGARHSIPPFIIWLRSLAVRSIICRQMTTGPGLIHVHADSESGHTSHELVTNIADASLERKAEKLRRAQADERHLWIWVDLEEFSMSSALSAAKFTRPSTCPDMTSGGVGEEIDVVWVAGSWIDWSDGSPKTPIFKCDGASWEQVALPMDAQQIIADAVERSRPS